MRDVIFSYYKKVLYSSIVPHYCVFSPKFNETNQIYYSDQFTGNIDWQGEKDTYTFGRNGADIIIELLLSNTRAINSPSLFKPRKLYLTPKPYSYAKINNLSINFFSFHSINC